MQAVGRLISKSVYTVSGPFHPFGGAVDIIVVEQPDGSYKSSPWYVRFGKFQGVLKTKEKVVSISVNGLEADFHMYLDHKGEAYFLKEVDVEEVDSACSPPSSSGEDTDRQAENRVPLKSKSSNYNANWSDSIVNERSMNVARTNSRRSQILGLVFGRRSKKDDGIQEEENASDVVRTDSLERAEIAADLLDLKWSTNLASSRRRKDNASRFSAVDISKDEVNENMQVDGCSYDKTGLISHSSYQELESSVEEIGVEMKCSTSEYVVGTATSVESVRDDTNLSNSETIMTDKLGSARSDFHMNSVTIISEIAKSDSQIQDSVEMLNGLSDTSFSKEENTSDNIQSFYYYKASESSGVGLDRSFEQKNSSICHGGHGEVCVHTESVQNITQSLPVVKSEPERDVIHAQEPLNIQECFGKGDQFCFIHDETTSMSGGATYGTSESIVTESYSQSVSLPPSNDSLKDIDSQSVATASSSSSSTCSPVEEQTILEEDEINKNGSSAGPLCDPKMSICDCVPPCIPASGVSEEEQLLFGNLDDFGDFGSGDAKNLEFSHGEADSSFSSRVVDGVNESIDAKCCSDFSLEQSVINDYINDVNLQRRRLRTISSDVCINKIGHVQSEELTRMVRSLPSMGPLNSNLEASDLGHSSNPSLYPGLNLGANNSHQSPGAQTAAEDVKILKESEEEPANPSIGNPSRSIDSLRESRRSWPFSFKRSRSMQVSHLDMNGGESPNAIEILKNTGDLEGEKNVTNMKVNKKKVRILTPSSEQLASLNLKEGKNIVIFTFSTGMLGKQQVDARIFLWRWDTRVVISDVDGTITRSDLLGQVMPWVGMDWSQTGVAHLFSAIKENGYQLLFLSARSISQSFHTRQFLFNIKQDGKALPDGPVVISPDGLFPSLFREVVRRAPHEFKIACLEDIKALFPADKNPFYAGFGNRDTDEFSYLKVGIPRGKIFIINPKGEIVVNRRVDTKSYLSLHGLVHGMFPTMSSSEQEDFNTWNYWKLPPPIVDL